jgi:hypothetical protein
MNFTMHRHHKYSLSELDNMIPWEREAYLIMLMQALEEEKEARKAQENAG